MTAIEQLHAELAKRGRTWGDENAARLAAVRKEVERNSGVGDDRRVVDGRQVQRVERGWRE